MARTSKQNVASAFTHFCNAFGFDQAGKYPEPGMFLDHASVYGGYVIAERHEGSSGEHHPFGSSRMKAGPLYDALWLAIRAQEHSKK